MNEVKDPRDRAPGDELTYGQALVELAGRVSWPTEAIGAEVRTAIEKEHGLYVEPQAPELSPEEQELADLRKQSEDTQRELAELRAAKAQREQQAQLDAANAELEALRAEAAGNTPAQPGETLSVDERAELEALRAARDATPA